MAKKNPEAEAGKPSINFEKELAKLEKIVEEREAGTPGLDQSIKLYETGLTSLKACQKRLAEAEARIKILVEGKEKNFDAAEAEKEAESDKKTPAKRSRQPRKAQGRGLF